MIAITRMEKIFCCMDANLRGATLDFPLLPA